MTTILKAINCDIIGNIFLNYDIAYAFYIFWCSFFLVDKYVLSQLNGEKNPVIKHFNLVW
jgi:hypothetical protein